MNLLTGGSSSASNGVAVVVVVTMVMVVVLLPSVTDSYRLDALEDLRELLHRNEESSQSQTREKVWKRELPLLVNLLKSIDEWERQRVQDKDSEAEDETSSIHQSKRGRDMVFGAMPPLGELCRMMGYASCPH